MTNHSTQNYIRNVQAQRAEKRAQYAADRARVIVATGDHCATGPVMRFDASTGAMATQRLLDTLCLCGTRLGTARWVEMPGSGSYAHLACADLVSKGYSPTAGDTQGGLF